MGILGLEVFNMSYKRRGDRHGSSGDGMKHKGFYAALYSCVGVMLVLAVVIGYTNFGAGRGPSDTNEVVDLPTRFALPDMGVADLNNVDSGFNEDAAAVAGGREEPLFGGSDGATQHDGVGTDNYARIDVNGYGNADDDYLEAWRRRNEEPEPTPAPTPQPVATPTPTPTPEPEPPDSQVFRYFDEYADTMAWPVLGDIVMNYSVNRLIFDRTLEQYRTNSNICIGAQFGAAVNAAADGMVKDISTTREGGRTVVVDHGNGWRTTYSQLQDNVLVNTGDVVSKGQQLGNVGTPSMFSSQLGTHLAFAVYKDNDTVDPNTLLR